MKQGILTLGLVSLLALGGCATTATSQKAADNVDPTNAHSDLYDPAAALAHYEKLYKKKSRDPEVALGYAQALRKTGNIQRAMVVLSGLARKDKAEPALLLEYAMINAAAGRYDVAQEFARKVIDDEKHGARAAHTLGISLDAQGDYKGAEHAYRDALTRWQGDPVPVMNNLGLSLANQGHLDQALEELRKAHALAPEREDVKKNLDIVVSLRDSLIPKP